MRRGRGWGAVPVGVVLAVLALLASCAAPAPEAPPPATRTVETAFGLVAVPDRPQRIVALDGTVGAVLDAGRVPVGMSFFDDKPEWFGPEEWARVDPVPVVWNADGPDVEAIARLEPDLVVRLTRVGGDNRVSDRDRTFFEQLRALVPATVFLPSAGGERVKDVAVTVSEILGDGERARADRDAYRARTAAIRQRLGPGLAAERVAVLGGNAGQGYVFGPLSWTGGILDDAGIPLSAGAQGAGNGNAAFFSYEQIPRVADATVVLYEVGADGRPTRSSAPVLAAPTFRTLPAVAAGRAYGLRFVYADRYRTALAVLDQVERILDRPTP